MPKLSSFTPGSDERIYLVKLSEALDEIKNSQPQILGISIGFDTYKDDSLIDLRLEISTYRKIGAMIKELEVLTFFCFRRRL